MTLSSVQTSWEKVWNKLGGCAKSPSHTSRSHFKWNTQRLPLYLQSCLHTNCTNYAPSSALVSAFVLHSPQAGWRCSRLGMPLVWCRRLNCKCVHWTLQLLLQSGINHGMLLDQTFAFKCSRDNSHPEMRLRTSRHIVHVAFVFHHELLRTEGLLQLGYYPCFSRSTKRRRCGIACLAECQQTTSGQHDATLHREKIPVIKKIFG